MFSQRPGQGGGERVWVGGGAGLIAEVSNPACRPLCGQFGQRLAEFRQCVDELLEHRLVGRLGGVVKGREHGLRVRGLGDHLEGGGTQAGKIRGERIADLCQQFGRLGLG